MQDHWSHDIRDPVGFCARYANQRELDYHQRERLIQFLLIALWKLAALYKPGSTITFSTFAGHWLPGRIIDWERSPEESGRTKWQFRDHTYERVLPGFVEYDEASVGAPELDPAERVDSDHERLDSERAISAASYLPPRSLFPDRGVRRASDREASSKAA